MTAAITPFTDTDKVRAALGVDDVDVSDDVMLSMQLDLELELDLKSWATGYEAYTGDTLSMLYLYAANYCALQALTGRELLYPILFKDGKAEARRFELDFDKIKAELLAKVSRWKKAIAEDQGITLDSGTSASYPLFGSAEPDYDPVTGA